VFDNARFAIERPDTVPPEFKAVVPVRTTQSDLAGTAVMPTLGTGELARSSQQVTEQIKRDSVTERPLDALPQTLTDYVMTPEGQLGTRLRTFDNGTQTITPSALTKQASVEVNGAGQSTKTTVTVPSVFGNQKFSIERPEVIPAAFRAAVPLETTSLEEAGTASMPTLGVNDVEKSMEQITAFVRRVTTRTRTLPGSFPTLTLRSWDSDLQTEIRTVLNIVSMGGSYTPGSDVIDYDEKELDDTRVLRVEYKLPAGLPAAYDTYEPAVRRFPALLTDIVVEKIQLADDANGDDRYEVRAFPVWRPGFSLETNYRVRTTFHTSPPTPDTIFAIVTQDIVYNGISFQVNIPNVLNDSLSGIGVSFSADGVYGNLTENFSVSASTPSATSYDGQIGTEKVIASKVQPWRRLWVKRTTFLTLL
jgi:hypothetical protein